MSDGDGIRQRLAAILSADAAGYSRLMGKDERGTVAALDAARAVFRSVVSAHDGRIVDTAGDSVLAVFGSATGALAAAAGIQRSLAAADAAVPEDRRLRFRIGVHLGEVIEKADGTVYGDGVNLAARLQALADPGGVLVSEAVRAALRGKPVAPLEDLGEKRVKNIAEPVRVYRVDTGEARRAARRRLPVRAAVGIALALLIAVSAGWLGLAEQASGTRARLAALLGQAPPAAARPVIAVLPLANLSGDPAREYFSDGITEDMIAALGRFSGLMVISYNSVQAYKDKSPGAQALRTELGARYVVQGSVREDQGRLRVAVELSDADKGVALWSDRFEGEGRELFEIQDRIVTRIVTSLQAQLTQIERERVLARPAESLEAYDLVLRARALLERIERNANRQARGLLDKALVLAPEYAEAVTALGEAELQRALYGWVEDPEEGMKRSEALARRTLASADARAHARAQVLLARIYSNLGRYQDALAHAEQATRLNPSDAVALFQQGAVLLYAGRIEEATSALESARKFDPGMNAANGQNLAIAYLMGGRNADALALLDVVLVRNPRYVALHAWRAAVLAELGRVDEAKESAERLRRLSPMFEAENFGLRFARPEHTARVQESLRKAGL